ncbi:Putative methyltransferase [Minicystis rosea]|nr:Putative methyltransferase [Minicystis rosea]
MKPAKKPSAKPVAKSVKKPLAKPVAKSAKKPLAKPASKSAKKPLAKRANAEGPAKRRSLGAAKKVAAKAKKPIGPRVAPAKDKAAQSDLDTVSWWDDFYRVVRRIPKGRVTTYGAVAMFAGRPRAARHVGYAMAALKDTRKNRDVPWQRVLGAASGQRARVTIKDPVGGAMQRAILEAEGVVFDTLGRISLARFGWKGPGSRG